jgi:hypothetical protein
LRGKIRAVRAEDWTESMRNVVLTPNMDYLTRKTAAYPWEFNLMLAASLVKAALKANIR